MRLLAALLLLLAAAWAEDGPAPDTSLRREVEEHIEEASPQPAGLSLDARWFHAPLLESADGAFRVRLRGRLLVDAYGATSDDLDSSATADGAFVRQARLGITGHAYANVLFMLEYDFAAGDARPQDVFFGLRRLGPFGRLELGNAREPFGLDATTPIPFHVFLERGASTRAFELGRNPGVRLHDRILGGRLTWWAGIFRDSDAFGSAQGDRGYAFTARVTGLAVRQAGRLLHVGLGSSLRRPVSDAVRYAARAGPSSATRLVDTGPLPADREERFAWAAAFRWEALTLQAEAYLVSVSGLGTDAGFHGWYVMGSWWLTGETAAYDEWNAVWDRVIPRRNLHDGSGGYGAWLVAARFDRVDLSDGGIDGGEMDSLTLGVTWMWNPNTRVKLDVVRADVRGGPLGTGTTWYLISRFQFDF